MYLKSYLGCGLRDLLSISGYLHFYLLHFKFKISCTLSTKTRYIVQCDPTFWIDILSVSDHFVHTFYRMYWMRKWQSYFPTPQVGKLPSAQQQVTLASGSLVSTGHVPGGATAAVATTTTWSQLMRSNTSATARGSSRSAGTFTTRASSQSRSNQSCSSSHSPWDWMR